VRLNLAGFRSDKGAESYGYSDRMDVGPGDERHPVAYRWGSNLALGATYTASRPSSPESKNPDTDGRELTNGKIIPPTDYMTDKTIQPATAFWGAGERAVFIVDLGSNQPVAAVRVSTHQPNAQFCHPRSVAVELSTDAKTWDPAGTIQHEDLGIRPDYEAGSTTRVGKMRIFPPGTFAYNFPLVLKGKALARYVASPALRWTEKVWGFPSCKCLAVST